MTDDDKKRHRNIFWKFLKKKKKKMDTLYVRQVNKLKVHMTRSVQFRVARVSYSAHAGITIKFIAINSLQKPQCTSLWYRVAVGHKLSYM